MSNSYFSEDIEIEKYRTFARNVPVSNFGLACMLVVFVLQNGSTGNKFISVYIPLFVGLIVVVRAFWWMRQADAQVTVRQARTQLRIAVSILMLCTILLLGSGIYTFFKVSSIETRFSVVFLLFAFGAGAFITMMHLRTVAMAVSVLTMGSSAFLMLHFNNYTMLGLALMTFILVGVVSSVIMRYHGEFLRLVRFRSEIHRLGVENARLASLDMLTGLPNRRSFFAGARAAEVVSKQSGRKLAIGVIDLDGFKAVNDTHGHPFGDSVLSRVAERLREALPIDMDLYRIGGDEFALRFQTSGDVREILTAGTALIAALREPIRIDDVPASVGCSIGFAIYPDMAATIETAFERADFALYHAKRTGRGRVVVFDGDHEERLMQQSRIEQSLRTADLDAEFYPVFQPIVNARSGTTVAFEMLARWRSPSLGEVSPATFVPIAEQAGLVSGLSVSMLAKALSNMGVWPQEVGLSFNLSTCDLVDHSVIQQVVSLVAASRVNPHRITFEITETALLQDFGAAERHIAFLKSMGLHVALDDFGTGFSSLSHVHRLPLDELKIDKQFVAQIETDEPSRKIVRSLVSLCEDMHLECVVEGVESREQVDLLVSLGCRLVQGYYYGKPMKADEIPRFLASARLHGSPGEP